MQIVTAPNFRDFGGDAPADGGRVRRGMLYRSEAIADPADGDAKMLGGIGMALVCDLRGAGERDHLPNRWWTAAGTECLALDILADLPAAPLWAALRAEPTANGARAMMLGVYRELPRAASSHLAKILARLAGGDLPILIHCTAGKDRTGFVCAMILSALGVDQHAIMADYLATNNRISDGVRAATARYATANLGYEVPRPVIDTLVGVTPDYLSASLSALVTEFGSIDAYLEIQAGLNDNRRRALRERLVVPRAPADDLANTYQSGGTRHEL